MSASNNPTLYPCNANAIARFAETVDFPTPPFPEATAMMFFTFDSMFSFSVGIMSTSISPKLSFKAFLAESNKKRFFSSSMFSRTRLNRIMSSPTSSSLTISQSIMLLPFGK